MEIEAKFTIPNAATHEQLLACRELAGFRIVPGRTVTNSDQYVDTAGHRLLAGGYACRLRREDETTLVTLKGLEEASGAIHRRDEREVYLTVPSLLPADWPDGPARSLAMELAAGEPLQPLLALRQTRARRDVYDGERLVGELTLDRVESAAGETAGEIEDEALPASPAAGAESALPAGKPGPSRACYYEMEIELKGEGTEDDLRRLDAVLRDEWRLAPQTQSKFERALAAAGVAAEPLSDRLAPAEEALLARYTGARSRPLSRRAAVILAWATGQSTSEIAARIGISAGRARYWIRSFRAHRMEIFNRARDEGPAAGWAGHPVEKPGGQEPAEVANLVAPAVTPAAEPTPAEPGKTAAPLLTPENPMSEAGRAIMYLHFQRMRDNEEGTRTGEDSEALHDMRVATRRMRAAYELFVPYYDEKTVRRFRKGLRNTGRSLGAVRDLDVLLTKVNKYDEQHPAGPDTSLAPMIADWNRQRNDAREHMLEYLDGKSYRSFVEEFLTFLTTLGAGAVARPDGVPVPYQVRHVVPRLLLARYQDVRAYEDLLPAAPLTTYHQLRIACKKLRYAMEFFKDVLGDPVTKLIKQVTSLQDLLGDLHDSVVAEELAANFLTGQIEQRPYQPQRIGLAGVTAYLTAQWTIQHDLLAAFPAQWAELDGYEFRRGLGLAVAAL